MEVGNDLASLGRRGKLGEFVANLTKGAHLPPFPEPHEEVIGQGANGCR